MVEKVPLDPPITGDNYALFWFLNSPLSVACADKMLISKLRLLWCRLPIGGRLIAGIRELVTHRGGGEVPV